MTPQDTTQGSSSQSSGISRGDDRSKPTSEPRRGLRNKGRTASDATGVNVDQRSPIDPRMPNMPPA